jgi:hypothetical protein
MAFRSASQRKAAFARMKQGEWQGEYYKTKGTKRTKWPSRSKSKVRVISYQDQEVYDEHGRLMGYRKVAVVKRR